MGVIMNNRSRTTLPTVLGMTILVVGLVYGLFIRPNFHRITGGEITFDALAVHELNTGLGETVSRMGDFLYVASEEGLTKLTLQGESVWNKSYHMNDPLFMVEEPYMAVVNLAGKNAFLLDEDGIIAEVKTDHTIVGGYLSEAGYISLVLENDTENYINVYDLEGETVVERRTIFKTDGYPIDVVMSHDGTKMMTSHLDISQHMIVSTVTFLDFSSVGEEFEDRVVGHERLSDVMAAEMFFFSDGNGVVIGDKMLNFYTMNPVPSLLNAVPATAVIEYVAHTDDQVIVSYGKATVPEGESLANTVTVYDSSGVQDAQFFMDAPVTGLTADDGTFYIIQSSKVTGYRSAVKQWTAVLYKPLSDIYHINSDRYLLEFDYDYEIVEIRDM